MRTIVVDRLRKPAQIIASGGLTAVLLPAPPRADGGLLKIRPARLAASVALFPPVLTAGPVTVAPTALGSSVSAFPPRVIAAGTAILPSVLLSTVSPFAPGVQPGGVAVQPLLRASNAVTFLPIVTAPAAGAVLPPLLASSAATPAPVVQPGGVAVVPTLLASAAAFYAPVVQTVAAGGILVDLLPSTATLFAAGIAAGAVTVLPLVRASGAQLFAPSVQPGAASVAPPALATTASFYAPSVLPGLATVTPSLVASSVILPAPMIGSGNAAIMPALLASTALTRPPLVTIGNDTLTNAILTIGDSWITQGQPPYPGFYTGYYFQQNPTLNNVNLAKGGQGLYWIRQEWDAIIAARPYIIHIDIGRNDFGDGSYMSPQYSGTEAQWIAAWTAYMKQILIDLKSQLPGVRIVLNTLTEQHPTGGNLDYVARFNNNRKAYNTQVRQWKTDGIIDRVLDYGADALIGQDGQFQPGDGYSNDGLHPNEAASAPTSGHNLIYANYYKPLMDELIASTPLPGNGSSGDPDVSSFAIGPSTVTHPEGNSGSTAFVYTVTRTGGVTFPASVDWTVTGSGTNAASAADFAGGTFPSGTATFAANATEATITVNVAGDTITESDETFTVTISNGRTFGTITTATAGGTITNDDTGGGGGTPTATYFNPADTDSGQTLSNNNLTTTANTSSGFHAARAQNGKTTGKWAITFTVAGTGGVSVGVGAGDYSLTDFLGTGNSSGWNIDGAYYSFGGQTSDGPGQPYGDGDVLTLAFLQTSNNTSKAWWAKNGTWLNGDPVAGTGGAYTGFNPLFVIAQPRVTGTSVTLSAANVSGFTSLI